MSCWKQVGMSTSIMYNIIMCSDIIVIYIRADIWCGCFPFLKNRYGWTRKNENHCTTKAKKQLDT